VATNDCHYLNPEDAEAQDILMLINTGADINDSSRLTMKNEDFQLKARNKWRKNSKIFPRQLLIHKKIVDLCEFEFELKKPNCLIFTPPEGLSNEQYLRQLCEKGLLNRYGTNPSKEILDRYQYEFNVIKQLGFIEYFLIVQDFVNWAKNNRIVVGPGRGSAAGSLIAYLLNITELDPLKYNFTFLSVFLNPGRSAVFFTGY